MPTCYVCGCAIPRGQGRRRRVNTGYSVAGFNFSSNPVMSLLLNSLVRKRQTPLRSYYSLQTLCTTCAAANDARERWKALIVVLAAIVAALAFVILLITSGHSYPLDWGESARGATVGRSGGQLSK
jgi:hypothetical protein